MAFENIFERGALKPCKKLSSALVRHFGIPRECLRAGLDATHSSPHNTCYAVFYDRDAHQQMAHQNEEDFHRLPAGQSQRHVLFPPSSETLGGFIRGFTAR